MINFGPIGFSGCSHILYPIPKVDTSIENRFNGGVERICLISIKRGLLHRGEIYVNVFCENRDVFGISELHKSNLMDVYHIKMKVFQ